MGMALGWRIGVLTGGLALAGPGGVLDSHETSAARAANAAAGPVLFADNFRSGSLSRWQADREGVWTVQRGVLRATLPDKKQEKSFLKAGSNEWTDYVVSLRVRGVRGVDKGLAVRVQADEGVGVDLRGDKYQDLVVYRGFVKHGEAPQPNRNGRWYRLRVEARGPSYKVFVNGRLRLSFTDGSRPRGGIALAAYTGGAGECVVEYDDVVVRALR